MSTTERICRVSNNGISVSAVMVLTLVCSSTGSSAPGGSRPEPILVGVSNAQSGTLCHLGKQLLAGSNAYFQQVNRAGGIGGRPVRLRILDDRYEPEPALSNTDELIKRDHVLLLFDYIGTPTLTRVLPLLRFYDAENIINLAPLSGAGPQRQPPYDRYVFNVRASYLEEANAIVSYFYGKGCRRFGFFGQADAFGKSGETALGTALADYKLTTAASVAYSRGSPFDSNMMLQVESLRRSGVDVVICFSAYEPAAAFIRDARHVGWNVPIANVSFADADMLLRKLASSSGAVGTDLTRNLVISQVLPDMTDHSPTVQRFLMSTSAELHNAVALEGWVNAEVLTEALKRTKGNIERPALKRALESMTDWDPGLGVPFRFSPSSHQALHSVWLMSSGAGHWNALGRFAEAP